MQNLQLKRLIYGLSNTIVVNLTTPKDILLQIELIKGTMAIDGFIFRPAFASKVELTDYTDADWLAMFAQYSLTYGWADRAEFLLGQKPTDIVQAYFKELGNVSFFPLHTDIKKYAVSGIEFYQKILKDIAESKIVLRQHQIEIIELMPIEFIEEAYQNYKFTIKETEILFMKRLMESGSTVFSFTEPDQIVRFLVAAFRSNGEAITGQLNKNILKDVELKIPTSIRKKILSDLDKMHTVPTVQKMHKYKDFWKRIFRQLAWASTKKMRYRYNRVYAMKDSLYDNMYIKPNTELEKYRKIGSLYVAFGMEMKNPGQMLRRLFSYLRYPEGSTYASKNPLSREPFNLADAIGLNPAGTQVVTSDIKSLLGSKLFIEILTKVNPKLLWQVLGMLDEDKWYKPMTSRVVNKKGISYSRALPGLDKEMAKLAKKAIKKAIKEVKREENKSLGKVYIDETAKNYKIQFSGRTDTSISLSGEYLSPGSRIKLSDLLKDKQDPILRVGLAWRGPSCDIDLSMNVLGQGTVYYGSPTLDKNGEILMSSSGDITSCDKTIFSTELVDIDIYRCKVNGVTKFFNSAIMYSGRHFNEYECYWFINVIDKKDRVIDTRKVTIKLDEMQYATKLQDPSKAQIGLYFNLEKDEIEVINIPSQTRNFNNADSMEAVFMKELENRPKLTNVAKALKSVIHKNQIVDKEEDANISISASGKLPSAITEGVQELIHPGRDQTRLQEIIF